MWSVFCAPITAASSGQRGRCLAREYQEGHLVASAYGVITAMSVDPIEKKPLNWFMPAGRFFRSGRLAVTFSATSARTVYRAAPRAWPTDSDRASCR
jgi:hypothetical protein